MLALVARRIFTRYTQVRPGRLSYLTSRVSSNSFASAALSETNVNVDPLRISSRCVKRMRELQDSRGVPLALRVRVDGGGCSGFQYAFELVEQEKEGKVENEDDHVFERDGVKVLVDDVSLAFIRGSEIDYEAEMIRSAFRVADNPNSESSCGCGVSFTAKT